MTLDVITDTGLSPFRHGFFGRRGGMSTGVYSGLNCGAGSADKAVDVVANRELVAGEIGVDANDLVSLHQVHSSRVVQVNGPMLCGRPRADAMVTTNPGVALGVLSADCQPVLLADPKARVVAAAHAGWKGALDGVLEATITAMEECGAQKHNIVAVIGPCISQQSYEVGAEFRQRFLQNDPANSRYFADGAGGKFQFDLPGFGVSRLLAAGVRQASWTGHCTYENPSRFFSFRYGQHNGHSDYGRLVSVIRI